MKTKFKKNGRRLLAAILCLVMAVMALPMSAFAWTSEEGVSCTSSFGDYYVGSDGGYYRSKSSYSFIVYDSDGNTSVRTISAGNAKRKYLMTDGSGTHQVYCVESGIDFNTGNSYVSQNGKNSSYFRKLPTEAQFGVMMALMYGWHEGKSSPVAGTNTDDYAFATQTIIWEYQQQLRTSPSDLHSANGIDADTYCYSLKGRPAEKCYDWILSQMASHYTIPSFAARNQNKADTYTLKYNPDKQNYSLTLTDTNNTLAKRHQGIQKRKSVHLYKRQNDCLAYYGIRTESRQSGLRRNAYLGLRRQANNGFGSFRPCIFLFQARYRNLRNGSYQKDLGGRCCIWHQIQYFWQRRKSNRRDQSRRHGRYFFDAGGLHRHRTAD